MTIANCKVKLKLWGKETIKKIAEEQELQEDNCYE